MKEIKQCKTCPWKVGCNPLEDIPNYQLDLAKGLTKTIQSGLESMCPVRHVMACHYSKDGEEIYCAGWLHNQLGPGNNIGVRISVMHGQMPIPIVEGPQHENYEDTLPCEPKEKADDAVRPTRSVPSVRANRVRTRSQGRPKRRPRLG